MKRWEQPIVNATYVPRFAEMLARSSLCIGARLNTRTGQWTRVFSRDDTPLTDRMLQFHAEQHGA